MDEKADLDYWYGLNKYGLMTIQTTLKPSEPPYGNLPGP